MASGKWVAAYSRVSTDKDAQLDRMIKNEKYITRTTFSLEADDPLRFDLDTLSVAPMTEFKKYHGVNASI